MRYLDRGKLLVCIAIVLCARVATADDRKWEIDAHGVVAASAQPTSGIASLGEPSMPVGTVPTWYFGDGGLLIGRIAQALRVAPPATLDGALKSSFIERGAGPGFGFRVSRTVTPRWSLELSFDNGFARTRVTDASRAALDQASAGFTSAFNALWRLRETTVTSVVSIDDGRGRQMLTTGALAINVANRGRLKPYATIGAGATIVRDESATAQVVGSYRFGIPVPAGFPIVPGSFHETDTVTVRASRGSAFTALFGGGVRYARSDRWGLRADIRDHVSPNRTTTIVTATPTSERTSSFVAFTSFGIFNGPTVQVSTVPGIPSTLSGKLADQPTFRGTGISHQINATIGVYWRF